MKKFWRKKQILFFPNLKKPNLTYTKLFKKFTLNQIPISTWDIILKHL